MRPEDFDFIAKMLKDRSGLVISRDKAYLLESRLTPVARKRGLKGLDELVASLRKAGEDLLREVTEAMTTNESFFFRDIKPFDQFKSMVLPQLLQTRAQKKSFRIWSAASSSGSGRWIRTPARCCGRRGRRSRRRCAPRRRRSARACASRGTA